MISVIYNPSHERYDVYVNGAHRGIAPTMADGVELGQAIQRDERAPQPSRLQPPVVVERRYPPLMQTENAVYCDMRVVATGTGDPAITAAVAVYQALAGGPLPEREQALTYARARRVLL